MTDLRFNNKIQTDVDGSIVQPIIVLGTRSGKKYGVINNIQALKISHPMNGASEISFDVYKYVNGIENPNWDMIKNFKFIYLPTVSDERYQWYEITVNIDESNDTIKHITGIHANEAELGQLILYEIEINTPDDIDRDDYETITIDGKEYGTVFFNPEHPNNSLLHRILKDKASHYEIIHVDETLCNIQREFSINGSSVYDTLVGTIGTEVQCLFEFGRKPIGGEESQFYRTISVYDLLDYCPDCGERGNYTEGVCTNCGGTNIQHGYGNDTGIFVNAENLTESISFTSNTDQVKNFFKLGTGDEYMDAAVRNCNPNGSAYLSYFSDEMKEDMSDALVAKLNEYDSTYNSYLKDRDIYLPNDDVMAYNTLVDKYQNRTSDELVSFVSPLQGFNKLTEYDYNAVNFLDILQTTMMPASSVIVETTALEQLNKLTVESMSPIGVENASAMSLTASDTAVKDYAKVYIDTSRYKIELSDSTYTNNTWHGTITVTSLTDEEDTAYKELTLEFNNDGATFTRQKIEKLIKEHEAEDIGDVSVLSIDKTLEEFEALLPNYSLDSLELLNTLCTSIMDILAQAGYANPDGRYAELYNQYYHPYWEKREAIMAEQTLREQEIESIKLMIDDIDRKRKEIINYLDLQNFFGDLYLELMLYRRESEYTNPNFISDGLTDSEVIANAQEFFKRAREEILKASTVQHTISANLYNLFLIPEFRKISNSPNLDFNNGGVQQFLRAFDSGNWLRVRVDDNVYKLRMINWEIDYDNPEELSVEFSDVIRSGGTMSDIASLLSQARNMATSYDTVMRQAEKGATASKEIKQTKKQGLLLSQSKIINDIAEQSFVIDTNGALMRGKNDFDDGYSSEQVKLLNKGIYYTNDNWETVKAGLGHFMYYDPDTNTVKEDYGIIASTIVGQLLLGENLRIYSESGKFEMGDDGLVITSIEGQDNTDLFVVQKEKIDDQGRKYVEKYIYVDSEGNVNIAGNSITIGGNPLVEYIEDTIENALPVTVEIESSAGNIFKNRGINTILTCVVKQGNEDISDRVTNYHWIKYDMNGNLDTSWSRGNVKIITLSPADVFSKGIFKCEVTFN